MIIRKENKQDYEAIYSVVKAAFDNAEQSDGNEQDLVNELRKGTAYIPELSLVAEDDEKIIGHIMFTKAKVGDHEVLALAPLSILPENQKQGVGTSLIQEGHRIATEMGFGYSVVLGSEKYYPRVGYIPANMYGIKPPFDVPSENFMAYRLLDESVQKLDGVMEYAKEFGIE